MAGFQSCSMMLFVLSLIEVSFRCSEEYMGRNRFDTEHYKENSGKGSTEFLRILYSSKEFVDKTMLIKDFVEDSARVMLITYPRVWGKSINLNMIKRFFEIEVDELGKRYERKESTVNSKAFQMVKISEFKEFVNKYQGEYPVIFVDFYFSSDDFDSLLLDIKDAICKAFREHDYLMHILSKNIEDAVNIYDRQVAQESLNEFKQFYYNDKEAITNSKLKGSLKFLCQLLYNHFGKQVYVLIEDYDRFFKRTLGYKKPIGINSMLPLDDFVRILDYLTDLYSVTFTENEFLAKGLITGVLRITKTGLLSGVNNLSEYNMIRNPFTQHYGFTQDEVKDLFMKHRIGDNLRIRAENWYDGYTTLPNSSLKIYNPWSIVTVLTDYKYWCNTESDDRIRFHLRSTTWQNCEVIDFVIYLLKNHRIRSSVLQLLRKQTIKLKIDDLNFGLQDIPRLRKLFAMNVNIEDGNREENATLELFCRLMLSWGYLTVTGDNELRIPNEVSSELVYQIYEHYSRYYDINHSLFYKVSDALSEIIELENKNTDKFKIALQNLIDGSYEFINTSKRREEPDSDDGWLKTLVECAVIRVVRDPIHETKVWYNKSKNFDTVLVRRDEKFAVFLDVKYNQSALTDLNQSHEHEDILNEYPKIKKNIILRCFSNRK